MIQIITYVHNFQSYVFILGERIGLMQTKLALIHIISKYELQPCKETLIPMQFDNLFPFTRALGSVTLNVKKH